MQTSNVVLHPAVLLRPDYLEALDTIEAECGPITISDDATTLDINRFDFDPEPAA